MSTSAKELTQLLNLEAKASLPDISKKRSIGRKGLSLLMPSRFHQQPEAPEPYKLTEDDKMYPDQGIGFGRVIDMNLNEGLQQIHASIGEKALEHAWLYLPEASKWIDITEEAEIDRAHTNQYIHVLLSRHFNQIDQLHTHPDKTVRDLSETDRAYSNNYLYEAAIPSTGDLMQMMQMDDQINPNSQTTGKIVSHFGVTDYSQRRDINRNAVFGINRFDRHITDTSRGPYETIITALAKQSERVIRYTNPNDEEIAFDFDFRLLNS